MKILVIEDDPTVGEFVRRGLEEQRWQADLVTNGLEGERMAVSQPYDLVILDMRLPGRNGLDVLRTLRARGFERPVLVLTAQDAVDAKVETLRAGADDYVTKPYRLRELVARMRAVLRRHGAANGTDGAVAEGDSREVLALDGVELDTDSHEVRVRGEVVNLPLKEFELLSLLMENAGRVLPRSTLIDRVWGSDYVGDTKTLDVHVKRVRSKIEDDPARPTRIVTIRGLGYKYANNR